MRPWISRLIRLSSRRPLSTDSSVVEWRNPGTDIQWLKDRLTTGSDPSGFSGCDCDGWEDSTWILHQLCRIEGAQLNRSLDGFIEGMSEHVPRVDVEEMASRMESCPWAGGMLGLPGHGSRVRWADLPREVIVLPPPPYPPCDLWFSTEHWPDDLLGPGVGSLDLSSLTALVDTLTGFTASGGGELITCYYSYLASGIADPVMCEVRLDELWRPVLGIRDRHGGISFTPSNFWPADRSWFVWTDYDLMATRVSGPKALIRELEQNDELELLRWTRPQEPVDS